MFVLDALRRLRQGRLTIPSFHLGHLGFRPDLEVDSQYVEFENRQGHELTLTPFQGSRDNLFIFKCIFREQPGVVARALSAFARMRLNVLSLESATIDRDTKHVLFCILSWAPSREKKPIHLDEATKHKFIDVLPLLPALDKRYIDFLEIFFLFCFDALEYEEMPGPEHLYLPRVSIKLFDDFYVEKNWRSLKISRQHLQVDPKDAKVIFPSVYVDLAAVVEESSPALLFSETETKALHVIFPKVGREKRFLHIGFTHQNRPGALLLIATFLHHCDFSIKTSLLRQHDIQHNVNVWETMLEFLGKSVDFIPEGKKGVEWFANWCFADSNPNAQQARSLINQLHAYGVKVCRPSYPRKGKDVDLEFEQISLKTDAASIGESPIGRDEVFEVRAHQVAARLSKLSEAADGKDKHAWLARLTYPSLFGAMKGRGVVFVSIPGHCRPYLDVISRRFSSELQLDVESYIRGDTAKSVSLAALAKIRNADFFLGVWNPEKKRDNELSPWMPFEFGAALALGKPFKLIAHHDIPSHVKRRIMKDYGMIEYDDNNFDDVMTSLISFCKRDWLPHVRG